jgi:hypothetical protein
MGQTRIPQNEWSRRLREFTARNACRQTVCETHADREVGAAPDDAPFLGATFDPWDGHIRILLGDATRTPYYRTVVVGNASDVEVLMTRDGRESGLRIKHPGGSTVLRFVARPFEGPRSATSPQYSSARKGASA